MQTNQGVEAGEQEIRTYCAQCKSRCPVICTVRDGVLHKVKPDPWHPNSGIFCLKGHHATDLVYNKSRLQQPLLRINPKGQEGTWRRASWDESLIEVARRLNTIKQQYGPEAVVFVTPGPGGSPSQDYDEWVARLANAFGTPNICSTTHICNWHKDRGAQLTFGSFPYGTGMAEPDFAHTGCILLWGHNPDVTWPAHWRDIKKARQRGAKLVVVDPRRTTAAAMADAWLPVQPGTDGAVALGLIHLLLAHGLFDRDFVTLWTNATYLVRADNGQLLTTAGLEGDAHPLVRLVANGKLVEAGAPGTAGYDLEAEGELGGVAYQTVFLTLRQLAAQYPPGRVEQLCGVGEADLERAARLLGTARPVCYYSYNGLGQHSNATQTLRALTLLYTMTGDYDAPGGNVIFPRPRVNNVRCGELLSQQIKERRLGYQQRPLGPAGDMGLVRPVEVYEAILSGRPNPVKAIVAFGSSLLTANPGVVHGIEALAQLEYLVNIDLFPTPLAPWADVLLPAASCWEAANLRTTFELSAECSAHLQYRPAVVAPVYQSLGDVEIIFQLAVHLGLGQYFWNGVVEDGLNYKLEPTGLTIEQLRYSSGGITLQLPLQYRKYSQAIAGKAAGFATPSRRIELFSTRMVRQGYHPLPEFIEPLWRREQGFNRKDFPLILTGGKVLEYCQSQGRSLPSLRQRRPEPMVDVHQETAAAVGVAPGDWVRVVSPWGSARARAHLVDDLPREVVRGQHGWWQECSALGLPGYPVCGYESANINLLVPDDLACDPVSGSHPLREVPCRIEREG